MRRFGVFCCVATLACHNPMAVRAGQEFTIALGEHVQVTDANLTIGFGAVPSDSRCPINAQCIWAGNAEVVLALHLGPSELKTPDRIVTLNTGIEPRDARFDGFRLELVDLAPYPVAGAPQQKPYRATLRLVAGMSLPSP